MVQTENLDLESAEADQLGISYLVDCVLDEIEQVKKSTSPVKQDVNPDDIADETMPVVTEDYFTPDLMDHIESAIVRPYDCKDQYYTYYDGTYQPQVPYQQPFTPPAAHQPQAAPILADLIDDVDEEYLNHMASRVDGDGMYDSHLYMPDKKTGTQNPHRLAISTANDLLEVEYNQLCSATERQVDTKIGNEDGGDTLQEQSQDNNEFADSCQELHKYSDLIKFPNITSSYPPIVTSTTTSVQNTPTPTPTLCTPAGVPSKASFQQQRVMFVQDRYDDDDANDTTASEFMSWTIKHPENWSTTEVLDWLYYTAEKNGVDCSQLRGEAFRAITGDQLSKMSLNDFTGLEPCYGRLFYELLREQIIGANFPPVPTCNYDMVKSYGDAQQTYDGSLASSPCDNRLVTSPCDSGIMSNASTVSPSQMSNHTSPEVQNYYQQQWRNTGNGNQIMHHASGMGEFTQPEYLTQTHQGYQYGYPGCSSYQVTPRQHNQYGRNKNEVRDKYDANGAPRRRPGRPRIKSIPTEEELQAQREKKLKSQHLWEFIYEMLSNPAFNPSILKWENQNEGVFRFVQSESVAQHWGQLKSNENMTYEKLSRAMRHYYKRGILERVEGRRLVYKFSLNTLDRLQQKKQKLFELAAGKYNFSVGLDKKLGNGQYNMAVPQCTKDVNVNCGQYSMPSLDNASRNRLYNVVDYDKPVLHTGQYSLPSHAQNLVNSSNVISGGANVISGSAQNITGNSNVISGNVPNVISGNVPNVISESMPTVMPEISGNVPNVITGITKGMSDNGTYPI